MGKVIEETPRKTPALIFFLYSLDCEDVRILLSYTIIHNAQIKRKLKGAKARLVHMKKDTRTCRKMLVEKDGWEERLIITKMSVLRPAT